MFERFTDPARRALLLAQEEARRLNRVSVGTEHILLGLIDERHGFAAMALESLGVSSAAVREQLGEPVGAGEVASPRSPAFDSRARRVLDLSFIEASQLGHSYIGTEHVLLGVVHEGEGVAAQVLVKLGADLPRVRRQVIQLLTGAEQVKPDE